jgi:hypothetical protein
VPADGDYDGDGRADIAVFRPSTGVWYILRSWSNTGLSLVWGTAGDIPVAGDYDGDHRTDVAVFRPSNGTWYANLTTGTTFAWFWGASEDRPVPGDFDGDGMNDLAVFRPSNGTWYVRNSRTGAGTVVQWGLASDIPVMQPQ